VEEFQGVKRGLRKGIETSYYWLALHDLCSGSIIMNTTLFFTKDKEDIHNRKDLSDEWKLSWDKEYCVQDRDGAKMLLRLLTERFGWLKNWADGGYAGKLVEWV
jgi:hypothetical protein